MIKLNKMPELSPEALEALSYVIVTCTEGGSYTREDYRKWTDYKHSETPDGFRAEVTVHPHGDVVEGVKGCPVRLTPEELGRRLFLNLLSPQVPKHLKAGIAAILFADEYGDGDVIRDGALMQIAVYGDVIFG